ncbi:MAG: HEXXH motif-containing putative peptide modification protein [Acidobacteriota bacterium]
MDIDLINDSVERTWTNSVPFGDWRYIHQRVIESVSRRLDLSQRLFPQATSILERIRALDEAATDRVLEHPFLRSAVLAATRHLKQPWEVLSQEQVEQYYEQLENLLAEGWRGGKLSSLSLLMEVEKENGENATSHTLWAWTGEQGDQTLTGITPTVFLKNSPNCVFRHPTEDECGNLRLGIELLGELFPILTPSVLQHIDVVTLVGAKPTRDEAGLRDDYPLSADPLVSCTTDTSPGVVFVSPSALTNPWYIAEIILHEGLHSKLYDVMATHNLLRPNYTGGESAQIHPLWHWSSASWDVQRSLFAMHVYAHLALFFQRAERSVDALEHRFGPLHVNDARLSMRRSLDRGHFLGMKLAEVGDQDLGPAGKLLLKQLQEMLVALDDACAVDDASRQGEVAQRLVVDMYARQTQALESILTHWTTIASHPQGKGIPAFLTEVAQLDADLAGGDAAIPSPAAGAEDTLRVLIDLRKQVAHRFMVNGNGASPSLDILADSATRSGRLFTRANIPVGLNP